MTEKKGKQEATKTCSSELVVCIRHQERGKKNSSSHSYEVIISFWSLLYFPLLMYTACLNNEKPASERRRESCRFKALGRVVIITPSCMKSSCKVTACICECSFVAAHKMRDLSRAKWIAAWMNSSQIRWRFRFRLLDNLEVVFSLFPLRIQITIKMCKSVWHGGAKKCQRLGCMRKKHINNWQKNNT